MKIRLLSDLHADYTKYKFKRGEEDLLCLLGDIYDGTEGIAWVKENIPEDLRTLIVLGNHDFYGHDYEETVTLWEETFKNTNITVLHNDHIMIEGVLFVGGTMFSDFNLSGISEAWFVRQRAKTAIQDFAMIKNWTTFRHTEEFEKFVNYLKYCYNMDIEKRKTVVLTHFCPSIKSVPDRFINSYLNPFWASDCEHLFYGADFWLHGHTHDRLDYEHADTRVCCNPLGNWMENTHFEENFIIEV